MNSTITLARNGPGGAQFQRNPALDQPLVSGSQPGCNPALSLDPATLLPECGIGYIFNNGFGGKMPGVAILDERRLRRPRLCRGSFVYAMGAFESHLLRS